MVNHARDGHVAPHAPGALLTGQGVAALLRRLPRGDYPEHSHDVIQVAVPLARASARATWHTATGGRRHKHLTADDVVIIPAGQPHAAE